MAISYLDSASGVMAAAVGVNIAIPATVAAGDRLLALIETNSVSGYTQVTPDGWTALEVFTGASGQPGGSTIGGLYTKVAGSADAGTTAYFEVTPSGSNTIGVLAAYRGTLTTPQVMAYDLLPYSGTASNLMPVPVLTVDALPSTLVTGAYRKSGTGTWVTTPPSGFTQRTTDTSAGNVVSIADAAASSTGSTSVGTWDGGVSASSGGTFLVVLTEGEVPMQSQPVFRRFTVSGWYPAIS